jgi:hypothetical protein
MDFTISIESDLKIEFKVHILTDLHTNMRNYFRDKDYGPGIQHFYIGCIFVKTPPGYENWYKVRKPKYQELAKVKMPDNSILELPGNYTYDIKPDYDLFVNATDDGSKKILFDEILASLSHLDKLPKRVKDFDKEQFKKDVKEFFEQY